MTRLPLPDDIQRLIREYSSDRMGVHAAVRPIKEFTPHCDWGDGYDSTPVETDETCFFRKPVKVDGAGWLPLGRLRFLHSDFDERHHPHHFGLHLRWENMRLQDQIERLLCVHSGET